VAADSPECGDTRRRTRRRGPRLCHGAPNRSQAGSTCSRSICVRNRAKKTVAPAIVTAYTERGWRGARRRVCAGAAVHVLDKEGWRSVAHHSRTTKTSWPAWKKLRWRGPATAAVRWRSGGEQGRSTREHRGCEPAARKTQRAPVQIQRKKKGR
jgi:hypothetical protein